MNELSPISPTNPVAAYMGGKRVLAKTIIAKINQTPHSGYAEPFVGMGGVFFRRNHKPKNEVINDINGEVINLFRILQRHYPQFMDMLKFQLTSRKEFERLKATDPKTLTDLERAARFLYLQKTAFGGKVTGQNYGVSNERSGRFNLNTLGPMLEDVYERLAGVSIENLPWQEFIPRYDRAGMLFYCDPPYWNCENDYGKNVFSKADFIAMAKVLKGLRGRFILSLNDVPEVREIFSAFNIEAVDCAYSISNGSTKKVGEVIISSV